VITDHHDDKQIVAYVVMNPELRMDARTLKNYLKLRLPDHMIHLPTGIERFL